MALITATSVEPKDDPDRLQAIVHVLDGAHRIKTLIAGKGGCKNLVFVISHNMIMEG
jgi:hypothetical protein